MDLLWQSRQPIARVDEPPDRGQLDGFRDRIAVVRRRARVASWLRDRAFLIVTPLGAGVAGELAFRLARRSWPVVARAWWPDWAHGSAAIYVWQLTGMRLHRGLAYQALWHRLFPGAGAEIWVLDPRVRHRDLAAAKAELRHGLPHLHPRLILPDLAFSAKLHPFHVPDRWELDVVARVASHMARPGQKTGVGPGMIPGAGPE